MNNTIEGFFKEYIYGFMYSDIEATLKTGANFLVALGLVSYTEILGGFVTGKLKNKNCSHKNFNSFLKYMGQGYIDLNREIDDIYSKIRCGLVHEYFIKGNSTIWTTNNQNSNCGITYDKSEDRIHFVISQYFNDFKKGVDSYFNELVEGKNKELIEAFNEARK